VTAGAGCGIEQPCPHGDQYTRAGGHPFETADAPLVDAPD